MRKPSPIVRKNESSAVSFSVVPTGSFRALLISSAREMYVAFDLVTVENGERTGAKSARDWTLFSLDDKASSVVDGGSKELGGENTAVLGDA